MSDGQHGLGADTAEFLLEILELRDPCLSGAAAELRPDPASRLIAAGLIVPDGYEAGSASLADHDDVPVSLVASAEAGQLAYFSPAVGLVTVPGHRLVRYRVDLPTVLATMTAELDLPRGQPRQPLVEGLLWEIGDARLGKRRSPLWFARRLSSPEVQRRVLEAARARPHTRQRVIVTSSRSARLRDVTVPGAAVVALRDVLVSAGQLAVSAEILEARLRGEEPTPQGPLVLSPDGTRLTILGGEPILFKSPIQIAAIRKLVDAHRAGTRVRVSDITDLGSPQRLFGHAKWALLKPHLRSENGLWGFDV